MKKPSILYIEDEPDYQVLVSGILGEAGLDTEVADTGDEGMDRLARQTPDFLLLDINLPDTSGYALCSRIRQEEAWAKMPIIMLTVRRRPNEWLEGFSNGADDYLSKPFNPPELVERVQTILNAKPVRTLNPQDPEHLLIEAALAGNRSAFKVLIDQYQPPLMNYVRQAVRNVAAAEDVVAASFTRAFQSLDRYRGDAAFYTWLYSIADNQIRNYWSHDNRMAPFDETLPTLSPAGHDPVTNIEKNLDGTAICQLRQAVRELPPEYRDPLRMHCLRGIPVESVARRLHIPLGTVLSRIFRGKALIRKAFDQNPDAW